MHLLLLLASIPAATLTEVQVNCGSPILSSTFVTCSIAGAPGSTFAAIDLSTSAAGPEVNLLTSAQITPSRVSSTAGAHVASDFDVLFRNGPAGAVGGYYSPCFEVGGRFERTGGHSSGTFTSPAGTVSHAVFAAGDPSSNCGGSLQTFFPFEYGVPVHVQLDLSSVASGITVAGGGSGAARFWILAYDAPRGTLLPDVVIETQNAEGFGTVPEPGTGLLMIVSLVVLMRLRARAGRTTMGP